jgi:protein-L-isoaspartate(D-aspartate) O-methyltransferase
MRRHLLLLGLLAALVVAAPEGRGDEYDEARARLMREIERDAVATLSWTGRRGFTAATMRAMRQVPRHLFVPRLLKSRAYDNRPLPIGHGQTISQPYIVALMTDILELEDAARVLEVGTGSGYQAAVLAALGAKVHTIEIIEPLALEAKRRLATLGYDNDTVRQGDGYYGWEEAAPFDAIIVTAAASHIPPPLVKQLKPGARMVIPVGARFLTQWLVVVEKDDAGKVTTRQILPVRFVPLTGQR